MTDASKAINALESAGLDVAGVTFENGDYTIHVSDPYSAEDERPTIQGVGGGTVKGGE